MPRTPEQFEQMREERRESILNTALRLFAEQGYETTSISQITKEAGISKGLIYNYFESKEHLLEEVIYKGFTYFPLMTEETLREMDPEQALKDMLRGVCGSLNEQRTFWKFYAELLLQLFRNDELLEKFSDDFEGFVHQFVMLMEQLGVPDPELEGRKLAAMLDGILLHSLYYDTYPLNEVFENIIRTYTTDRHD